MTNEFRENWILAEGDTIRCGDVVYTISGKPLGYGGSAVLYPATRSGSSLEYAIKECFPRKEGRFRRQDGIIQPTDDDGQIILEQYRRMMEKERELGQRIRNTSSRAIGIWETLNPTAITTGGRCYTGVSGGIYAALERMDRKGMTFRQLLDDIGKERSAGHPLRTGGLPHIHTTACIMEQVLLALLQIHKAGYLFGDIQEGNVFFSDCMPEMGDIGIGNLLDFGSARELADGKKTGPILDRQVFSTDGFRPPEIRDGNNGHLQLGPEADVFSAGCLMLRCLVSKFRLKGLGDTPNIGPNTLDPQDGGKIGCGGSLLKDVNTILQNAMAADPSLRYPDAGAMLTAIRELKGKTELPRARLRQNMSMLVSFVPGSRERELEALSAAVNRKEPVFIWGLGGMGKTETAIALASRIQPPKGAYLVHFRESIRKTILQMEWDGYSFDSKKRGMSEVALEEAEYQDRMEILRKQYPGALLIIDNFDCPGKTLDELRSEKAFQELSQTGISLVFTTRYPVTWQPEHEIRELSADHQLALMRRFYRNPNASDDELQALIRQVGGHTLTVVLAAKTLEAGEGRITPGMMLESLKKSSISLENHPKVTTDQNRSYTQARIYEHLKTVFNLSAMTPAEYAVLSYCAFLPDGGMELALFEQGLEAWETEGRRMLVQRGWLSRSGGNILTIHPMIREMIREDIRPGFKGCGGFIGKLNALLDADSRALCVLDGHSVRWIPASLDESKAQQLAALFCEAADYLQDADGKLAWAAANALIRAKRYTKAGKYAQAALDHGTGSDSALLTEGYRDASLFYLKLDWNLSLEYARKEQALQEQAPGSDPRKTTELYARLCSLHFYEFRYGIRWKQNHLDDALAYGQKALEWAERCVPSDKLLISRVHNTLADLYWQMRCRGNDVTEALKIGPRRYIALNRSLDRNRDLEIRHRKTALRYAQAMRPRCDSWEAALCELLGNASEGDTARTYYETALELRLAAQVPIPSGQAMVYENIAVLYENLGDRKTALTYKMRKTALTANRWYYRVIEAAQLYINALMEAVEQCLSDGMRLLSAIKLLVYILLAVPVLIAGLFAGIFVIGDLLTQLKEQKTREQNDR